MKLVRHISIPPELNLEPVVFPVTTERVSLYVDELRSILDKFCDSVKLGPEHFQ